MALDFNKLSKGLSDAKVIEPRKIFTTLSRKPRFRRPTDEQGEVFDSWFSKRLRRDNTLKMSTGSGKTLVGLVLLQSSLNEGVFPAVYVSADNYLVEQVLTEADDLGVVATDNPDDPDFRSGKAVLVVNVWKLINGRSVFGVGTTGVRIPIGALVVDDAHGCLATVADQFSLKLSADHPVYEGLVALFSSELERQSLSSLLDVKAGDPYALMTVPFWAWKDRQKEVVEVVHQHRGDDRLMFTWPLLRDVLELCQCVIGGRGLEIAPRCLPIDMIPAFVRAKRRIYMTATLADDGILVTHFQADVAAVADPIKPRGAGDIGDRMILAPQEINPDITIDELKQLAVITAATRNVVVIVPSSKRAAYWRDVSAQVLDRENIGAGVEKLKGGHVGLTVLVNKYDGVDLPGDACRMLIINGLPEVYGLIERVEMSVLDGTEMQLLRQVQRIEQGMGRGVRSSEDFCVVLLLGGRLTQRIHLPAARAKFTPATLAQLDLGRAVTEQVRGKPLSELRPVLSYCLVDQI
jgi:RAD3-like DEAD/DEAH box helicase